VTAADSILLTGTVGVGKTTVLIEIGELLETRGEPYAVLDLDWLAWLRPAPDSGATVRSVLIENLSQVAATFRAAGVRRIVLARMVTEGADIDAIRAGLGTERLVVVRLVADAQVVGERLRTRDRGAQLAAHLDEAETLDRAADAAGIGDLVVRTDDADAGVVARAVLQHAGWA
jgi:dephospho-CoA kinase